jgi:TorA maturation chaperone TorD
VLQGKSIAYNVFSRVFKDVPDKESDEFIKGTAKYLIHMAESSESKDFQKGAEKLRHLFGTQDFLNADMETGLLDRSRDYTRLFVMGAHSVSAYESVYTSPQQLIKQESWSKVRRFYTENFFKRAEDDNTLEDHISMELQFMGLLCSKAARLLEAEEFDAAEEVINAQNNFFNEHLSLWVFDLCDNIIEAEELSTEFYQSYSLMLKGFMFEESAFLKEVAS